MFLRQPSPLSLGSLAQRLALPTLGRRLRLPKLCF